MTFGYCTYLAEDRWTLGVLVGELVFSLSQLVNEAPEDFEALLPRWDDVTEQVNTALSTIPAGGVSADAVTFSAPGLNRPAVYCAGANYTDHVEEMGVQLVDLPFHFVSPQGTLNAHGAIVRRPRGVEKLDWEVELAAVIGRPARNVPRERALEFVAGYTVANDVSVRDPYIFHPIFGMDWMAAKNSEGLTPIGPAVVPARFVGDPQALDVSLTVNGEVRQKSNTRLQIVDLARQIESLSSRLTLQPGDIVLTGTPAGTAAAYGVYLADGDRMVATIESVGILSNTIAS